MILHVIIVIIELSVLKMKCTKCGNELNITNFHKRKKKTGEGYYAIQPCKQCRRKNTTHVVPLFKICTKCKMLKSVRDFYTFKHKLKSGKQVQYTQSVCKTC